MVEAPVVLPIVRVLPEEEARIVLLIEERVVKVAVDGEVTPIAVL